MKVPITYCGKTSDLKLPDSCSIDVFFAPEERLSPIENQHWLNSGILPSDLKAFLESSGDLLVVVNDQFRPTPTATVLQALSNLLQIERTTFLVATALHPPPNPTELKVIFGEFYSRAKHRIVIHSAYDDHGLAEFGSGEDVVRLNVLLNDFEKILTIGSVEPHYFAGFTGGRKIFLPGLSSFEDTRRNHALALSEKSRPLATVGNPVWEDIKRRTQPLNSKNIYSIQLVGGYNKQILFTASGDLDNSYRQACGYVVANYAHAVKPGYDIVVSVAYPPLDRNLYQLQKSYENVAAVVRDGGTILLISGCVDGVGDQRFVELAAAIAEGKEVEKRLENSDTMGIHKIKRTARLSENIDLMLVSTLTAEQLRDLHIQPCSDIKESIKQLLKKYGTDCRIAVVLDSASQVLYPQSTATVNPCSNHGGKKSCVGK